MGSEIQVKAEAVFRKVFRNPNLCISREMQARDVRGWDSLAHINLIMAIEDSFKVKFATREVLGFRNVGDILDLLEEKTRSNCC